MLNVKQNKVEQFYDCLDEICLIINNYSKLDYLECLIKACDFILNNPVELDIDDDGIKLINDQLAKIDEEKFNKEEVRHAYQLAMLKGFKHIDANISEITPDTIGILISYFTNYLFNKTDQISVLDATVGTANLLTTVINNSTNIQFANIYGVDVNYGYMNLGLKLAQLLNYNIEFINQNALKPFLVAPVDLIICDLPIGDEVNYLPEELITVKNNMSYEPYLLIEGLMKYSKEGGYLIYLIPNDFFTHENNQIIKDIILQVTFIQAIIQLPQSLFGNASIHKSILILRKRGVGILPTKEILMLDFPDFSEVNKVNRAIDKINQWFKNIK
ncbi:MAG: hypothetical protein K0Q49_1731 [Haloplasmataceae bacterium]|jgi:site-specific DNA-methyltransferase (adenine-specific)|nr:hypothetical protein [Haloplasmataceae bacterium]